jgi:hypothetical protein
MPVLHPKLEQVAQKEKLAGTVPEGIQESLEQHGAPGIGLGIKGAQVQIRNKEGGFVQVDTPG